MVLLDLLYVMAIAMLAPWLMWRSLKTGRYRNHLGAKLLGRIRCSNPQGHPVVWFHAVSVGEVTLLGTLIPSFQKRHPDYSIVISATTDTGLAAARQRFVEHSVIAWPFDFSWAVSAALDSIQPSLIVLTESELWPNFLRASKARRIPVVVVNARLSPRSFLRLRRIAGLARHWLFANITRFAVQEEEYAWRLRELGVPDEKLVVTGSVKYDGALRDRDSAPTLALRQLFGIADSAGLLIWLAGSTHAPEETIILHVFTSLHLRFPHLRLILVPRHPDRFDEVARLVEQSGLPFVRRSIVQQPLSELPPVLLLDSIGELGAAWGLADLGFTGGSLDGKRGGQSMIEPAGYGVPCAFGPHVWNFKDAARRLVEVGGAVMVSHEQALELELGRLVANSILRLQMGRAARELIHRQQGATIRTLDVIDGLLAATVSSHAA